MRYDSSSSSASTTVDELHPERSADRSFIVNRVETDGGLPQSLFGRGILPAKEREREQGRAGPSFICICPGKIGKRIQNRQRNNRRGPTKRMACEDRVGNRYGQFVGTVASQCNSSSATSYFVDITYTKDGITFDDNGRGGNRNPRSITDLDRKMGRLSWTQMQDFGERSSWDANLNSNLFLEDESGYWQFVGVTTSEDVLFGELNFTSSQGC